MRGSNRDEGVLSDSHPDDSSGCEDQQMSPCELPSLKGALRRRMQASCKPAFSLVDAKPCLFHGVDDCAACCEGGRVVKRLFADNAATSCTPSSPAAEGTAGHVQARGGARTSVQQQQKQREEMEDAACELAFRRCIYSTARWVRLLCLCLTPLLLLLLFLGPTLYNKLPPAARQISSLAFPALRLWAEPPSPRRQHPSPLCNNTRVGFFGSLFSFPALNFGGSSPEGAEEGLSSLAALRTEFAKYTEGKVEAPSVLLEQSLQFNKEVMQVAEGVYVALGFGLANSIILEGPEGFVVVDTMESTEAMREVWQAWNKLREQERQQQQQQEQQQQLQQEQQEQKHVKGIIYTHFHTDHTFGAAAIYEEGVTEVHAYSLTGVEMEKVLTVTAGTTYRRGMRQFGVYVHSSDFVHAGIGPFLRYNKAAGIGSILPTHIMTGERKKINLAGLELELLHAPGESRDQIVVWLSEKKVLIGADNMYKSLPNIYAIRGTETRNCNDWVASLDMMRALKPSVLVLGHTRPLFGEVYIHSTLTAYRDAIQFLHDQTVRLMNKGMTLNDIAQTVQLPKHLAEHPFLQPLYGTVPWAVRAIFTHYMGWFSGSPEELSQLSTLEKAEALLDLAGSFDNLLKNSFKALKDKRFEWALEVATAAHTLQPNSQYAKELRVFALRALASKQTAATGRNWYLTAALEVEGSARISLSDTQKRQVLQRLSMGQIFALLPVRLNPEAAETLDSAILFRFDTMEETAEKETVQNETGMHSWQQQDAAASQAEQQQCVHFRRGIVYTRTACERDPDVVVETTAAAWLRILTKETSAIAAAARGDIKVTGSLLLLVRSLAAVELDAE